MTVIKENNFVSDYTQFKYFMLLYSYEKIIIEAGSPKSRGLNFLTIQLFRDKIFGFTKNERSKAAIAR